MNTAYSVVEEYMRRGYEAARAYERVINQEGTMGHYDRHSGCDRDGWNPMEAMMAPWMMMTRAWLDTVSCFMPGAGGMGSAWANRGSGCSCGCGSGTQCSRSYAEVDKCSCGCGASAWEDCRGHRHHRRDPIRNRIGLHVRSDRYTEHCLKLRPGADEYQITVKDLVYRDDSGNEHKLPVKVDTLSSDRTLVRVAVPRTVPAGDYSQSIYCGGRRCGSVCVTVFDDDGFGPGDNLSEPKKPAGGGKGGKSPGAPTA